MTANSNLDSKYAQDLWAQYQDELRRWLLAHAPAPTDAADILQEVFIKVLRSQKTLGSVTQPRAWLFEITRNALIDWRRKDPHFLPLPEDVEALPALEGEEPVVDALAQACLPRVLSEMSRQDREVIELCDLQGMPQADYARLKALSLTAAKSRVQRARQRMRQRMTEACQVSFDPTGRVVDYVPRPPTPD